MNLQTLISSRLSLLTREYFGRLHPGLEGITTFSLVSRRQIYKLNSLHRGANKSTDILAFPSASSLIQPQSVLKEEFLNAKIRGKCWPISFGHLIICPAVIERKLKEIRSDRVKGLRVMRLLIHGFVHLSNLDHHTMKEFNVMRSLENELLKRTIHKWK